MISKTFKVMAAFITAISLSILCAHSYAGGPVNPLNTSEIVQITKAL